MKKFDIFLIFAQNIDCGYTLEPPRRGVQTGTHNLCFGPKKKKNIGIPLHTPVLLCKSGVQGGIHNTNMFFVMHMEYAFAVKFDVDKKDDGKMFANTKNGKEGGKKRIQIHSLTVWKPLGQV